MIAATRFVFLHLHKSGGTFVNELLLRHVPGAQQIGYHLPRSMVPAALRALPVLGLVRNPWSYYVSWYAFQAGRPRQNALFRVLSRNGQLGFGATIRNMLELADRDELIDELAQALPASYGGGGLNLPGPILAHIRGSGVGFYSFLYAYLYAPAPDTIEPRDPLIGRMETLRPDLLRMLATVGEPVTPAMRAQIEQGAAVNVSQHEPYTTYYDQALRERVAERDAALIARHGYTFG